MSEAQSQDKERHSDRPKQASFETDRRRRLREAVLRKYPKPAYAVFFDVDARVFNKKTLSRKTRGFSKVDCLVMSLYSSRNFEYIAIQFALDLDQIHEIANCDIRKNPILGCVDKLFAATDLIDTDLRQLLESPQHLREPNEIGLMQLQNEGLRILVSSPIQKPSLPNRDLIASLVRQSQESGFSEGMDKQKAKEKQRFAHTQFEIDFELNHNRAEIAKLKKKILDLEFLLEQAEFDLKKAKALPRRSIRKSQFNGARRTPEPTQTPEP